VRLVGEAHDGSVPREATCADVVVLGAGLAGLSAALGFARRGRRVRVLERDPDSPLPKRPDLVFDCWERAGVAHFRQPHNFLGLARRALIDEAPDVLDRVVGDGAFENRQFELLPGAMEPGDDDLVSLCTRRPVFERALRTAVENEPNVTLEHGVRVAGLIGERANGAVRVAGARTREGRIVEGDILVDALGRSSPLGAWLGELGARPLSIRRGDCGLVYYSRHFRLRPGVELPPIASLLRGPRGETGYLVFVVFLGDNGTFALVLMIPPWDRELRALRHESAFMTAALSVPALVPWIHPDCADPVTPVLPMGSLQNVHRSLVVDGTPVAVGVHPIGDALCHTNPTFALGASLSLDHGFALSKLAERIEDPYELSAAFEATIGADAAARFDAVSAEDRDRIRLWQGEAIDVRDPNDSLALFVRLTAYPAAMKDPALFRAVARRVNALDPPDALATDESLVARALEIAGGEEPSPRTGPTREELLGLIAGAAAGGPRGA
jgi:2-polyprenyl-6-methoxyphenol hydroxylase-like FAD-dependent oxidoreductase